VHRPVLDGMLAELRAVATPGTRLALSTSVSLPAGDQGVRERFAASLAAAGEPARNTLTAESVGELLNRARWRAVEVSERAQRLGFVVSAPIWCPALPPAPATKSTIGGYLDRTFHRNGTDTLAGHLQTTYGVGLERLHRLDVGVYRAHIAPPVTKTLVPWVSGYTAGVLRMMIRLTILSSLTVK
jgi:hypothetical protein